MTLKLQMVLVQIIQSDSTVHRSRLLEPKHRDLDILETAVLKNLNF